MSQEGEQLHAQRPAWPIGGISHVSVTGWGEEAGKGIGSGYPQLSTAVREFGLNSLEGY